MATRSTPVPQVRRPIMWAEQSNEHYAEMAKNAGIEGSPRFEGKYHFTRNREHAIQR